MSPTDAKRLAAMILKRLSALYGQQFVGMWSSVDDDALLATWAQAVATLTPAQVERGLNACFTHLGAPTLPQFLHLCRAVPGEVLRDLPALPAPIDRAKAAAQMAKVRRLMRSAPPSTQWASRVLERAARGEPISTCAVRMAQSVVDAMARTPTRPDDDPERDPEPLGGSPDADDPRWAEKATHGQPEPGAYG